MGYRSFVPGEGIEPAFVAWEATVLPLYESRAKLLNQILSFQPHNDGINGYFRATCKQRSPLTNTLVGSFWIYSVCLSLYSRTRVLFRRIISDINADVF